MYKAFGKRLFDIAVTIPLLVLCLPVFIVVAVLVRLDSSGPVLFVQDRLGYKGRLFPTYKFRTMVHRERTDHPEIYGRNPEVTFVGHWLRRFKVDELPQLLNILKGDMSLVGPRPALPAQLSLYDDITFGRLLVRPGLTGFAQINGNIYLSWPDRWQYDIAYADRLSFRFDLWIISRTFRVVFRGEHRDLLPPRAPEEGKIV